MIHTHVCLSAGFVALISPIFPQNKSPCPTPIPPRASGEDGRRESGGVGGGGTHSFTRTTSASTLNIW